MYFPKYMFQNTKYRGKGSNIFYNYQIFNIFYLII